MHACRNGKGYDVAKAWAKFTHISPVWLQLRAPGGAFALAGRHDIDKGWMADVRKAGGQVILNAITPGILSPLASTQKAFLQKFWIRRWCSRH